MVFVKNKDLHKAIAIAHWVWSAVGIGGILEGIDTCIFASKSINSSGANGLIYGNIKLVGIQLIARVAYSAVMTFIILKAVKFNLLR